jgi:hypothetical protein
MYDEATIQRFLAVKALAERGMPGEMDNAQRILKKMEVDYPGIRAQAQKQKSPSPSSAPRPAAPHSTRQGNWENIFQQFAGVASAAYDFTQHMANAYAGVELAKQVEHYTRIVKSEKVLLALKMPQHIYWQAKGLNPLQVQAFRRELHVLLDKELDRMFGPSSGT